MDNINTTVNAQHFSQEKKKKKSQISVLQYNSILVSQKCYHQTLPDGAI